MFSTPLPPHPRLFASADDWKAIRMRIETDPFSQHLWHALRQKADLYKDTPPVTYTFTGRRLLAQSRRCLEHILTLAAAARLTGDRSYAARAIAEMRDVARFPDWNPSHYLDVAEMAAALAIGYDWLYDELTDADRDLVAGALELLALRPSFDGPRENLWWVEGTNNWNQVCHGGLSLAALAIAERRPELAQAVVQRALANIPRAAHSYAPDGAYAEGPTYWDYGTLYHVLLAAALERVTGSAQGLDEFPGFRESGDYIPQVTTPTGRLYCYSDADERRLFAIPLFWFARRFQCPELVRHELENLERYLDAYEKQAHNEDFRYLALALLWAPVPVAARPAAPRPLRWHARGVNPIAVFRSAWDDPAALFAGLKGGSPRDPHAHMDAGSYILEADGVRWALDLEKQDYAVIEGAGLALWDARQDADRWKVFRLGPDSHNILRFDGAAPCITGRAEFLHVETAGSMPRAVLDLDSLYAGQVASARRGLAWLARGVLLQDEWQAGANAVEVAWQMLTRAQIEVDGRGLRLRQDGRALTLSILAPEDLRVEVRDVSKPAQPYDVPNPGVSKIVLHTRTAAGTRGRLRVLAMSGEDFAADDVAVPQALAAWTQPEVPDHAL